MLMKFYANMITNSLKVNIRCFFQERKNAFYFSCSNLHVCVRQQCQILSIGCIGFFIFDESKIKIYSVVLLMNLNPLLTKLAKKSVILILLHILF